MKTTTQSPSQSKVMWVPPLPLPWVKKSSTFTHTKSPSFQDHRHPPSSPIHHHSPSLKDIHTLLLNHPPPFSPLHKHSLSSTPSSPARTPARTHHHHPSVSFKDIESLLSENTSSHPPRTQAQAQPRKPSIFHRVKTWAHRHQAQQHHPPPPPDSSNKVVVYFTSLHVIRRTYEDCRAVRSILKAYRVKMDERDLSMDATFVGELQRITGNHNNKKEKELSLPRVYVNGKYVGGAEEIRRLHESGELKRMIQGLPMAEGGVCEMCGGFRFGVCEWCDGSRRVFVDNKVGFKTCGVCNVYGLILCPYCTSVVF